MLATKPGDRRYSDRPRPATLSGGLSCNLRVGGQASAKLDNGERITITLKATRNGSAELTISSPQHVRFFREPNPVA